MNDNKIQIISEHKDTIPFNFTYYAMKLLGKNLYSNPWTAISEIVANGIDAKADNIYVLVDMRKKDNAVVEIFDDGKGMSFEDLSKKYALIGRNKREDHTDNIQGATLGRKGIGKLAALYLSPKYYLSTKTNGYHSTWVVDTAKFKDSEIPELTKVKVEDEIFVGKRQWNNIKTGTMIHLSNVDLRKIGTERIKSLPAILSDYYLENIVQSKIKICVLSDMNQEIDFIDIRKDVSYETLYSIFDNTKLGYKNKVKDYIYVSREEICELDLPKKVVVLDETKYETKSTMLLNDLQGMPQEVPYELVGWIGIHCSLDSQVLLRNTQNAKKLQMHPNALRLYVRGKLAVSNLMTYVGSSQAFANYIEGDVSFDILDEDNYEDSSTSNREGFSINDPRVQKLLEIIKKIITSLILERVKIGTIITKEKDAHNEKLIFDEKIKQEAELRKRKEAEAAKIKAENAQIEAEKQRTLAEERAKIAKEQTYFLKKELTDDVKARSYNTHVIKNNSERISGNILELLETHSECKNYKQLKAISIANSKISVAVKYYNRVSYDFKSKKLKVDICKFLSEYIKNISSQDYRDISFIVENDIEFIMSFPTQDITLMIDNIISNAIKFKAKSILMKTTKMANGVSIKFSNDGEKLNPNFAVEDLFEFGMSTSTINGIKTGTGVGLYQIKDLVTRTMKGEVDIYNNDIAGITLEIKLYENKL